MQQRTIRMPAYVLIFVIGTIVIDGYDILSSGNITDQFFFYIRRCFG